MMPIKEIPRNPIVKGIVTKALCNPPNCHKTDVTFVFLYQHLSSDLFETRRKKNKSQNPLCITEVSYRLIFLFSIQTSNDEISAKF